MESTCVKDVNIARIHPIYFSHIYYWCSWYGKEVKTPINRCDKITLKTEQI